MPFPDQYLLYALCGGLAGILRDIMTTGGVTLPCCKKTPDGMTLLKLGCIASIVIGVAAGILADHSWLTAVIAGWAGPDFIERAVAIPAQRKRTQDEKANGANRS